MAETTRSERRKKKIKKAYGIVKGGTKAVDGIAALYKAIQNHPAWYQNYPLKGLTNLNFGVRESLRGVDGVTIGTFKRPSPPDCRIFVDLVLPKSGGKSDGFWEGMQILMNKLRAATGSNVTYSIVDLALYVLSGREIIAEYASDKRIALSLRVADAYDTDAPVKYALMAAASITGEPELNDLTVNLASDVARLNRLVPIISNMIPLNIDLHHRAAWMFSNIFADSVGAKFSTKMFVTGGTTVWRLKSGTTDTVERVETPHPLVFSQRVTILEGLVADFMNNPQNSRIAGDILKAFGTQAFMPVVGIDEGMKIAPIFDASALSQIQNASILRLDQNSVGPTIESSPTLGTTITYSGIPASVAARVPYCTSCNTHKIVNAPTDEVNPAQVISLTRLVNFASAADDGTITVTACGTEIPFILQWITSIAPTNGGKIADSVVDPYTAPLDAAACWAMDDYAPETIIGVDPNDSKKKKTLMDLSNWADASILDVGDYHGIAALSLVATPDSIREQSSFKFVL